MNLLHAFQFLKQEQCTQSTQLMLLYTAAGIMNLIYTGVSMILVYSFERKKICIFLPLTLTLTFSNYFIIAHFIESNISNAVCVTK